jgi:hypothetical protein
LYCQLGLHDNAFYNSCVLPDIITPASGSLVGGCYSSTSGGDESNEHRCRHEFFPTAGYAVLFGLVIGVTMIILKTNNTKKHRRRNHQPYICNDRCSI